MRIISTKEERKQLIESLVNEETNLFPLDREDCDYLKDVQTIIEYVFRTNLVKNENRVDELRQIICEADLSNIKGFHYLYFVIRSSLKYEITMAEMSDIAKVVLKVHDDKAFSKPDVLWTVTYENNLDYNLELVMIASK